jgi:hypothetical protein
MSGELEAHEVKAAIENATTKKEAKRLIELIKSEFLSYTP